MPSTPFQVHDVSVDDYVVTLKTDVWLAIAPALDAFSVTSYDICRVKGSALRIGIGEDAVSQRAESIKNGTSTSTLERLDVLKRLKFLVPALLDDEVLLIVKEEGWSSMALSN